MVLNKRFKIENWFQWVHIYLGSLPYLLFLWIIILHELFGDKIYFETWEGFLTLYSILSIFIFIIVIIIGILARLEEIKGFNKDIHATVELISVVGILLAFFVLLQYFMIQY